MQQVHLLALQQIDLNFANKGFAGFMDVWMRCHTGIDFNIAKSEVQVFFQFIKHLSSAHQIDVQCKAD